MHPVPGRYLPGCHPNWLAVFQDALPWADMVDRNLVAQLDWLAKRDLPVSNGDSSPGLQKARGNADVVVRVQTDDVDSRNRAHAQALADGETRNNRSGMRAILLHCVPSAYYVQLGRERCYSLRVARPSAENLLSRLVGWALLPVAVLTGRSARPTATSARPILNRQHLSKAPKGVSPLDLTAAEAPPARV